VGRGENGGENRGVREECILDGGMSEMERKGERGEK